jgi:hypothetical protein
MTVATRTVSQRQGVIVGAGLLVVAAVVVGVVTLLSGVSYDLSGAALIGAVLFLGSLPILAREARREGDPRLFRFLVLALLAKFAWTLVRYYVTFHVYGAADAVRYFRDGSQIADQLRAGTYHADIGSLSGSDFISFSTGVVFWIVGTTKLGGFLVFSWLAYWGLFFFYRAFTLGVPEGRTRSYARLLFFLPSIAYWPASLGKDSWMVFALGIAAFGAARVLAGAPVRGMVMAGLGMWLTAFVRPYVGGMLILALFGAYLIQRRERTTRVLAPIVRIVGIVLIGVLAVVLVVRSASFLKVSEISPSAATSELETVSTRSAHGGSEVTPTIVRSPTQIPVAMVTVLFRPLLFEAHNAQALAAALESTFLLVLSLFRLRSIVSGLKKVRRQPYVALSIAYLLMFVVAFASFPNLGLLSRQRVQVLPFYLVLLCLPTGRDQAEGTPAATRARRSELGPLVR